ncbi:MAG: hypothetical protein Q6K80_05770 [Thermostichus sp. DG_1_6_bins_120]
MTQLHEFLYPRHPYHGVFTPANLLFDANLQEFSQRVGYISSLTTNGKLTPQEAYHQIRQHWKNLKRSRKALGIGQEEQHKPDQ